MHDRIASQAKELAERLSETVQRCLPGSVTLAALREPSGRVQITAVTVDDDGNPIPDPTDMPLFARGVHVASWRMSMHLVLDRSGRYLKTTQSALSLRSVWEKTPLVRLEYRSDMRTAPIAHWQFHAERGAFSHLLARAARSSEYVTDAPHSLATLHIPVGGERFRPSIEDFIEFLVRECGVDCKPAWEDALSDSREIWRRMQARAVIRDLQAEAAELLKIEGWTVTPPDGFEEGTSPDSLTRW